MGFPSGPAGSETSDKRKMVDGWIMAHHCLGVKAWFYGYALGLDQGNCWRIHDANDEMLSWKLKAVCSSSADPSWAQLPPLTCA